MEAMKRSEMLVTRDWFIMGVNAIAHQLHPFQ
jgi:hypothetical protein